ncbi:acyltransferase family protein [Clostridium neonatale]|uniref:acyltransferase family protein n=1 Tax=Clostridium neonatale TaxID=137838 RepID=UPI003D340386
MYSELKQSKKYYKEINIIRGIVVLFVLLGHSFPDFETGMTHFYALLITRFCYSFHMGLFFIISGFLETSKLLCLEVNFKLELIKKAKRLLVPYLVYSFVTLGLKQIFNVYANNSFSIKDVWKIFIGINPNGGLWFLWALFLIWGIAFCMFRYFKNIYFLIMLGIILHILNLFFSFGFLYPILRYFVFYTIGMIIYKNYPKYKNMLKTNIILPIISLCIVMFFSVLSSLGIIKEQFYLISSLFGSYAIWNISIRISAKDSFINKMFNLFGDYSYDLYLLSYFAQMSVRTIFARMFNLEYWIVVLLMFVFGIIFPYVLSKYFLRKNKYTSLFFLGK